MSGLGRVGLSQGNNGVKPANAAESDKRRLEIIEELSESLANDLLELSVAARDRDLQLTAEYFPPSFAGKAFPARPMQTVDQVKWVGVHKWEASASFVNAADNVGDARTSRITSKAFLQTWSEF